MAYRGATRPYGMGEDQYAAYAAAMAETGFSKERIVQTIGNAAASAGTHAKDGVDQHGHDYCCATDIHITDLSEAQIHKVLLALASHGFCGWWRHTGSFANNQHCHFVYAGYAMKHMLQSQVHDFLAHRNGLVGHATDTWWAANLSKDIEQKIRTMFLAHNPPTMGVTNPLTDLGTDTDCCSEDDGVSANHPDGV